MRAQVCTAVVNMIKWMVKDNHMVWFVLENVPGIMKRKRGDPESFSDWLMKFIISELEAEGCMGWTIVLRPHTSADCGLCQHRDRVFFVGIAPCLRTKAVQRSLLSAPLPVRPQVGLLSVVERRSSAEDFDGLTPNQQLNVMAQVKKFDDMEAADPNFKHPMAVIDAGRNPDKDSVDDNLKFDRCSTFRTNNKLIWIVPQKALRDIFGPYGRFMSKEEKCRASGLEPRSLVDLSTHRVEVAIGNTIPPPLIGDVLAPVLASWTMYMRDLQDASLDEHSCVCVVPVHHAC